MRPPEPQKPRDQQPTQLPEARSIDGSPGMSKQPTQAPGQPDFNGLIRQRISNPPPGLQTHPFQGVFYLEFASMCQAYAHTHQFVSTSRQIRSRACGGGVMLAGSASCRRRATKGEIPSNLKYLARLAQARQDPYVDGPGRSI